MRSFVTDHLTNQRPPSDKIILRVLKHMAAWKLIPLLIFFGNFVWENVIFLCNYNCSGLSPGLETNHNIISEISPDSSDTLFNWKPFQETVILSMDAKLWEIIKGWWEGSTLQFESKAKHYYQKPQQPKHHYIELFHQLTDPALLDTEYFNRKWQIR